MNFLNFNCCFIDLVSRNCTPNEAGRFLANNLESMPNNILLRRIFFHRSNEQTELNRFKIVYSKTYENILQMYMTHFI